MTPLEEIIRAEVSERGPMGIDRFMELCLSHPDHGYYMTRDPLGVAGDFTTAPEISQMFGELVGLWLAQAWLNIGSPDRFNLVELGPGRGTLMADILRVGGSVSGFLDAARVHLIETSPVLRDVQKQALASYQVTWVDRISSLNDAPMLLIANEFFDALPVKQFQKIGDAWVELKLKCEDEGFKVGPARGDTPTRTPLVSDGSVIEISPMSIKTMEIISTIITSQDGAALIFDYGNVDGKGATLQAVKNHEYVYPFTEFGEADLTVHVNFGDLGRAIGECHANLTTQGQFLTAMGIASRGEDLAKGKDDATVEALEIATRRLTDADQMGTLFKTMAVTKGGTPTPPGF